MFVQSEKIHVFPSTIPRTHDAYARVLTEDHILDVIRSSSVDTNFVLTNEYKDDQPFEFVINGYYVLLDASSESKHTFATFVPGTVPSNVYAHIFIDTTAHLHPQLAGADDTDTNEFTGVIFSDSATCNAPAAVSGHCEHHYLPLLEKTAAGTLVIPASSRRTIDGGLIE